MYDLWRVIIFTFVLGVLSFIDIKYKRIPVSGVILILGLSLYEILNGNEEDYLWYFMGCTPGIAMIFLSIVTRERVGLGDGFLLMALGLGLGAEVSIMMLVIALLTCCFVSGVLYMGHKVSGKSRIPFVPFITVGMEVVLLAYK